MVEASTSAFPHTAHNTGSKTSSPLKAFSILAFRMSLSPPSVAGFTMLLDKTASVTSMLLVIPCAEHACSPVAGAG